MAKAKTPYHERPIELPSSIVIRISETMRERLRREAFKARVSSSAMARMLIEAGLKAKREQAS